jgi:hypothetical protein
MPQQFALDVVYKSDVTPKVTPDLAHPIAMAYGFVAIGQTNPEVGEKVDLSINAGDSVTFSIFDIAAAPAPISSVVINVNDVTPPNNPNNPIKNVSPFGWPDGTQRWVNPTFTHVPPNGYSTGCNMVAFGLVLGNFTAQAAPGRKNKTYDITVTITLQNGRVFQVDPEMDVMAELR